MAKLTADAITDTDIQRTRDEIHARSLRSALSATEHEFLDVSITAIWAPLGSLRRTEARARCADLINARAAGKEQK